MLDYKLEDVSFTNHILERYVERTMGKTGNEIKQFIAQNSDSIKEKLLKLYNSAEHLWSGKIKEHNFTHFYVNRDGWVIVVDKEGKKLITVYKVYLELGTEFNKMYIEKVKESVQSQAMDIGDFTVFIEEKKEENKNTINSLQQDNKVLQSKIDFNNSQIEAIKSSEDVYAKELAVKEKELQQKIEKFIGARIF